MATVRDIIEGSPPYLHTRYLSVAEQAYCEENPTYAAQLADLRALRLEIQRAQIVLDVAQRAQQHTKRQIAGMRSELNRFEATFMTRDNELARLAEALRERPDFRNTEVVELVGGRWVWTLPAPAPQERGDQMVVIAERRLPRHDVSEMEDLQPAGPTPVQILSGRLSRSVSRLLPGRGNNDSENWNWAF